MVNLTLDKLSIANNLADIDEVLELFEYEDDDEILKQSEFDNKTEEQNDIVTGDINKDEKEINILQTKDLKSIPATPQKPVQATLKQMFSTTSKKRKDIETGRIEREGNDLKHVKLNE